MEPIFFPHIWLDDDLVELVRGCFERLILYQPSHLVAQAQLQKWIEGGFVELRVPITGDESKLKMLLQDFHKWGILHEKDKVMKALYMKLNGQHQPYFDETSTSQIRADVKKYRAGATDPHKPDPLLASRIFLHFAHDWDRQSRDIDQEMKQHAIQERALIAELKGETGAAAPLSRDDPGNYLTAERVAAWAHLYISDQKTEKSDDGLFLTQSRVVWDYICDCMPQGVEILRCTQIPANSRNDGDRERWSAALHHFLTDLSREKWKSKGRVLEDPPGATLDKSLTIYMIPDTPPAAFWSHLVNAKGDAQADRETPCAVRNTLIGHLGTG